MPNALTTTISAVPWSKAQATLFALKAKVLQNEFALGGEFQDVGAISYVRGRIQIPGRQKLEETACECYRVVKRSSIAYLDDRGASHGRPSMVNE